MKLYTTTEAATLLAAAHPTITLHARKLGFAKHGRDYLFTDADLAAMRASMHGKPGRPRKTPEQSD